jgi:histone acetyltransferase (RNA polymerase elongator complex component)
MFLKGSFNGIQFDNTTEEELVSWINLLTEISPQKVMIYSIARDTPAENLVGIELEQLELIRKRVESETSISVQVSG